MFRYCEIKQFWQKIVIPAPSLIPNIFPYQKFSETQNGSLAKFFWSCEIKKISTKPWSFPLLCLQFFDTRILSKHRRVLLRILSALRDKDFSTEFSDSPFLCIKFFATRIFLIHRSVPQRNFSVLWDKNFWKESRDIPLFCIEYRNQWWNWCL